MPAILGYLTEGDKLAYGAQDWYQVSRLDLGNGHREACIQKRTTVSDLPHWWGLPKPPEKLTAYQQEQLELENRARACRRAKSQVRKKCKVLGVDSLWTLTYRERVTDVAVLLRDWQLFVRRVRAVMPGFAYVATVEEQARGALHMHIATHRLPARLVHPVAGVRVKSWPLLLAIWRSVTGPRGGSFNERKRKAHSRSAAHKIASYISKYVAKQFDQARDGAHRYFVSQGVVIPRAVVELFRAEELATLIAIVHEWADGERNEFFYDAGRGLFWMSGERPP